MISYASLALLLSAGQVSGVPKLTVVPRESNTLSIQALIPLPKLLPEEKAAVEVLTAFQVAENAEFSKAKIISLCSPGGRPRGEVTGDHVRIWLKVNKPDLRIGLTILRSVLNRPNLEDQEAIQSTINLLDSRNPVFWRQALVPERLDYGKVQPRWVRAMFAKLYNRADIRVVVSGEAEESKVQNELSDIWKDWQWIIPTYLTPRVFEDKFWPRANGAATLLNLRGPTRTPATIDEDLLASIMLGIGKDCTLYHRLRQQENLSYRQEAYLWPTSEGYELRLVLGTSASIEPGVEKKIVDLLSGDAEGWTEKDRLRAVALAETMFLRTYDQFPLAYRPYGGQIGSAEEDAFMALYWPFKFGQRWDPDGLVQRLQEVPLEKAKLAAKQMLSGMKAITISGS